MLTTKQKAKLKSLAMQEKAILQVGKDDVSDNLIKTLNLALEARELVKLHVLKTLTTPLTEVADNLAKKTNSELVQIIGRNVVLYKKSKNNLIKL